MDANTHAMRRSNTAPLLLATLGRWLLVCCVLLGLGGQLLLQSNALPDEAPRVTFERLTGLQIGSDQPDPTAMPISHMSAGHMHMMPHAKTHEHSGHHHDGSCPLCPLLHLPAVIFSLAFIAALILVAWSRPAYSVRLPRGPPLCAIALRPPPTGPPIFI